MLYLAVLQVVDSVLIILDIGATTALEIGSRGLARFPSVCETVGETMALAVHE